MFICLMTKLILRCLISIIEGRRQSTGESTSRIRERRAIGIVGLCTIYWSTCSNIKLHTADSDGVCERRKIRHNTSHRQCLDRRAPIRAISSNGGQLSRAGRFATVFAAEQTTSAMIESMLGLNLVVLIGWENHLEQADSEVEQPGHLHGAVGPDDALTRVRHATNAVECPPWTQKQAETPRQAVLAKRQQSLGSTNDDFRRL
jgi:hypothetical protein